MYLPMLVFTEALIPDPYSPLAKPARVPLTQQKTLFHTRIHTFNIVSLLLA